MNRIADEVKDILESADPNVTVVVAIDNSQLSPAECSCNPESTEDPED